MHGSFIGDCDTLNLPEFLKCLALYSLKRCPHCVFMFLIKTTYYFGFCLTLFFLEKEDIFLPKWVLLDIPKHKV